MKLLKNEKDFERWRVNNIFEGSEAETPKEFPCFVTKKVKNWGYEEERAVYFYRKTLVDMIKQLEEIA